MIAARGDKQIALRLPMDLRDRVKAGARQSGRSMNSEILFHLERVFAAPAAATGAGFADTTPAAALNPADVGSVGQFQPQHEEC